MKVLGSVIPVMSIQCFCKMTNTKGQTNNRCKMKISERALHCFLTSSCLPVPLFLPVCKMFIFMLLFAVAFYCRSRHQSASQSLCVCRANWFLVLGIIAAKPHYITDQTLLGLWDKVTPAYSHPRLHPAPNSAPADAASTHRATSVSTWRFGLLLLREDRADGRLGDIPQSQSLFSELLSFFRPLTA